MSRPRVTRFADDAYFVESTAVNWTILADGDDVTLIDAGYPGDLPAVLHSLEETGHRPEQISAVLITHAHTDHIGALPELLRLAPQAQVLTSKVEAAHVRREYLEQISLGDALGNVWRPGFLPWIWHALRIGGKKNVRVPQARAFDGDGAVDVPGRPVPVVTPGHTSGHTCYLLPGSGAVVTGDALVTGHPTSRLKGPQLLADVFHHDRIGTRTSLDHLRALDAHIVLPGHGPVHRGAVSEAVTTALTDDGWDTGTR